MRPCTRIGPDGFTLRETVAEYYQVARLTPRELEQNGIIAPDEYLEALRALWRDRRSRTAAPDGSDRAHPALPADDDDGSTTPIYGGGTLIFDEYCRLKYHVQNDVFGKRQNERLAYLWRSGQLTPGPDRRRLAATRLSAIHRQRALDTRRFPQEGW